MITNSHLSEEKGYKGKKGNGYCTCDIMWFYGVIIQHCELCDHFYVWERKDYKSTHIMQLWLLWFNCDQQAYKCFNCFSALTKVQMSYCCEIWWSALMRMFISMEKQKKPEFVLMVCIHYCSIVWFCKIFKNIFLSPMFIKAGFIWLKKQ